MKVIKTVRFYDNPHSGKVAPQRHSFLMEIIELLQGLMVIDY